MQAKQRYILVFLSCAFLALCYFGGYRLKQLNFTRARDWQMLDSYIENDEIMEQRLWSSPKLKREELRTSPNRKQCRMETCFDFSKCENENSFKVYVYPIEGGAAISSTYRKILNILIESRYWRTIQL